jgi:hypothetical protein
MLCSLSELSEEEIAIGTIQLEADIHLAEAIARARPQPSGESLAP